MHNFLKKNLLFLGFGTITSACEFNKIKDIGKIANYVIYKSSLKGIIFTNTQFIISVSKINHCDNINNHSYFEGLKHSKICTNPQ